MLSVPVLRRLVALMVFAALGAAAFTVFHDSLVNRPPGDYETERGEISLDANDYDAALAWFEEALRASPSHRGAMMGRAIVLIETGRHALAIDQLSALITELRASHAPDDGTARGALAAAYANRGIVHDREGRYSEALGDYLAALETDEGAVAGPGIIHRVVYDSRPSTVRDRARYLEAELGKPEQDRLMRIPEIDARQRRHRP